MEAAEARGLPVEPGKRPPMSAQSIDLVKRAQELVQAGKPVSDACYESRCGLSALPALRTPPGDATAPDQPRRHVVLVRTDAGAQPVHRQLTVSAPKHPNPPESAT